MSKLFITNGDVLSKSMKKDIAISKMIDVFERMLQENMLSHFGDDLAEQTILDVKKLIGIV